MTITILTYFKARQNFSSLMNAASKDGEILVRRRDGRLFGIRTQVKKKSPFNINGGKTKVTTKEILEIIRESSSRP